MIETRMRLGALGKGVTAQIREVGGEEYSLDLVTRLLEMGFLEGSHLEVIHEAPFGGDPIAVRVRGSIVALRRSEANAIEVVVVSTTITRGGE